MCIYFKVRSKNYQKYYYCTKRKREIGFNDCKCCKQKEYKKQTAIKKKSSKLAKLERQRDKDIVKSGRCDYCHEYSKRLDPHEVYGGSNRKRSIENNFVKKLCRKCHSNEEIINQLKKDVQREYEETHTREEFIKITGKSYI